MNLTEKFWENTYRKNIGNMIGICYRYVLNKEIAEDLAQNAFLTALEKSDSFTGKGHIDAWIRKITVNTALQYLRSQKSNPAYDDWMRNEEQIIQTAEEENDRDHKPANDFSCEELLEALNFLPEHHRLVFNMYVLDKLPHNQIAEELNISIGTSKSHLSRARKKLREILFQKQKKEKSRKFLLLFIFPVNLGCIDKLYCSKFKDFQIEPQYSFTFNNVDFTNISIPSYIGKSFFSLKNAFIIGLPLAAVISTLFLISQMQTGSSNEELSNTIITKDTAFVENPKDDTIRAIEIITDTAETKTPVVIKKTVVKRKTTVIRDTVTIKN